ncbi:ISAon1 family transposase N-terminal region protein [Bacteroides coprosuis]|uniref:ISAon1 family transposase N-terminal region protein n=1 Tax=Bacteroides coprosuis TaxID=151276 RepID=UPI001D32C9ED|nr:transposase [Bacteroides coprosuis]HJD92295.1 transposase [Bacteroides coprosuis]
MSWDPLVRFILPDGLFDYFEMSDFKPGNSEVHICLEEVNITPVEYQNDKLESKGFYEEIKMHDYPLRGRSCIMHIKRRRWMNHTIGKVVTRNWELVAKGTQISSEFASFLKAMDRLSRH